VYRWQFDKGKQSLTVAVNGPLIVDDVEIMIRAAIDGVGLAFLLEENAAPHLASGALARRSSKPCVSAREKTRPPDDLAWDRRDASSDVYALRTAPALGR